MQLIGKALSVTNTVPREQYNEEKESCNEYIYFDIFSVYLFSEVLASVFLYVTCMLYVFKLLCEKQTKYHLRQSKLGIKSCLKTENSPLIQMITACILCLFTGHYCSSVPKGAC